MAGFRKIFFQSSNDVEFRHPIDVRSDPPNPLDNSNDGATATFSVYDAEKSEVLRESEPSSEVTLAVTNAGAFSLGDTVEIDLDSGSTHSALVSSIDESADQIVISVGLPSAAQAGSRVRTRLSGPTVMVEYGTASADGANWGFRGTFDADPPTFRVGQFANVETSFSGSPGGGLDLLTIIRGQVVEDEDEC